MRFFRFPLLALAILVAIAAFSYFFTLAQLSAARARGVYATAEEGMRAQLERAYSPDRQVRILYSGPNSFDGSLPYVWYVIAEVHASARADGSSLSKAGCDAPGSYFLQTRQGWVLVPEGAFPELVGFWMGVFDLAGPGQAQPSIPRAPDQPVNFCGAKWYR